MGCEYCCDYHEFEVEDYSDAAVQILREAMSSPAQSSEYVVDARITSLIADLDRLEDAEVVLAMRGFDDVTLHGPDDVSLDEEMQDLRDEILELVRQQRKEV